MQVSAPRWPEIKAGNAASRRLFESTGFAEAGREDDVVIYRHEPAEARHG